MESYRRFAALDNFHVRSATRRARCNDSRSPGASHGVPAARLWRICTQRRHGLARIAAHANAGVDLDLAKEWHAIGFGDTPTFPVTKNVHALLTMRTDEVAHILDD